MKTYCIIWEGQNRRSTIDVFHQFTQSLSMNFQSFSSLFSSRLLNRDTILTKMLIFKRFIWPCLAVSYVATQALSAGSAKALNIQIIVDNDFALFSGTSTGINTLLFQNNVIWGSQNLLHVIADAPASDNVYYLLAMDGGSEAEAFGKISSINLTTAPGVKVSNIPTTSLTGYDLSTVTNGSYVALLADVHAAFPSLAFAAPSATSCGTVCNAFLGLSNGKSFGFNEGSAVVYSIPIPVPGPIPIPVPGPIPIFGVLSAFQMSRRIRRRIRSANI